MIKSLQLVFFVLSVSTCYSQDAKIKKQFTSVYLGNYNNGEVELQEEHDSPRIDTYDENGNFLSSERLDSIGGEPFSALVYTYNPDGTINSYKNCNGTRDEIWSFVGFIYDEKGNQIKETHFDRENPNGDTFWQYEYDSLENLILEQYVVQNKVQRSHLIDITYQDSVIVKKVIREYQLEKLIVHRIEHYENEQMVLKEEIHKGATWTYSYNDDGTVKTETSDFGDGLNVFYSYYKYDEHGNTTLRVNCYESGFGQIEVISYEYY